MKKEKEEYIQLPPLKKDTDIRVIEAIWSYLQLSEESRKRVFDFLVDVKDGKVDYSTSSIQAYRKIRKENS